MAKAIIEQTISENIFSEYDPEAIMERKIKELSAANPINVFVVGVFPSGKTVVYGYKNWSSVPVDTPATRGTLNDFGGFFKGGKVVKLTAGYQNKLNRANARTSNR